MPEKASRRGAVDPGVILMVAAFVVIAGFLYWLSGQAELERAVRIVEDTPEVVDEFADARTVMPTDLQPDATGLVGELVRVVGVGVASTLGRQGFWLDFPQGPFLVALPERMVADSAQVSPEARVTVTGTVTAMSDSIVASWVGAGRISEGDGLAAGFATHFVQAARVEGN